LGDLLQRRLDGGKCLVMLDGLDEVASADQRRTVVSAVANFVTAYARQGNRFVVTSRISGYLAAPLPEPFEAVELQDMDDPTIARFLEVYCREVERAEAPEKSDQAIRHAAFLEASKIDQALRGNAGVQPPTRCYWPRWCWSTGPAADCRTAGSRRTSRRAMRLGGPGAAFRGSNRPNYQTSACCTVG
jgi:hypothetical protein